MYTINPGEFKHSIELKKEKFATNSTKVAKPEYEPLLTCKAKIINMSGKEVILSGGINNINQKRFIIRYPNHVIINENARLVYNNTNYNIIYLSNVKEENKYLEIVAEVIK